MAKVKNRISAHGRLHSKSRLSRKGDGGRRKSARISKSRTATGKSGSSNGPIRKDLRKLQHKLERSQAEMNACSQALLVAIDDLLAAERVKTKLALLQEVLQDGLLTDLARLGSLELPAEVCMVPDACLNWISRNFDVSQFLERGQRIEMSRSQLQDVEILGSDAPEPGGLLLVEVDQPGWRVSGRLMILPKVRVVGS